MKFWPSVLAVAAVVAGTTLTAEKKTGAREPSGGSATLYIATYTGGIQILDEATERITGEIKLRNGLPNAMSLSDDRTKFIVLDATLQKLELVDIATRQTVDTFTLSEANRRARIFAYGMDPLNRYMILVTHTATKLIDRWDIAPPTIVQYDLKEHRIVRTIKWPNDDEREFVQIKFSPDGKLMYFFGGDVTIFDTTDFHTVDTWALSKPLEAGAGRIEFRAVDEFNDERGFFTGIFSMQDPVNKRRLTGVGRVDLAARNIDFFTFGPEQPEMAFALAPDRKKAYALSQDIGRYEYLTFDLQAHRVESRREFPGRPRMDLSVSSNGRLLYVFEAGNTIDVYTASEFKYLRTITLPGDSASGLYVLPASTAKPSTTTTTQ
jgi:hypothetical protein